MTSIYAEVIGDPVSQSKSPLIHLFWLKALGLDGDYRAHQVIRSELAAYLEARRADPAWRGCNVTMPLKLDALLLADQRTDRATASGAIPRPEAAIPTLVAAGPDVPLLDPGAGHPGRLGQQWP